MKSEDRRSTITQRGKAPMLSEEEESWRRGGEKVKVCGEKSDGCMI